MKTANIAKLTTIPYIQQLFTTLSMPTSPGEASSMLIAPR
jgi:hypothetical protein